MTQFLLRLTLAIFIQFAAAVSTFAAFYSEGDLGGFLSAHPNSMSGKRIIVPSSMYDLSITWYQLPESPATGGALVFQNDLIIVVDPRGGIAWVDMRKRQGPFSTGIVAPMNLEGLVKAGVDSKINMTWFRATGAHAEQRGDILRLFVSHHAFENGCIYLQMSAIDLMFSRDKGIHQASDWQTIFKPQPCINIGDASKRAFGGLQAGGKIVSLNEKELLVTYGDHQIDGGRASHNSPQDPKSPYGKIWKVAKDGTSHSIYASGVRNPQGLFIDKQGRIWESEHGPQGGDELNIITEGANYGWPLQTFGVGYSNYPWPLNPVQGDHSDSKFAHPKFAWIPSIAPTAITQVNAAMFELWKDDLLVLTLKDQSIRRLRIDDAHVVYDERIEIGHRLRDIVAAPDGRLFVLDDSQMLGVIEAPGPNLFASGGSDKDALTGAEIFKLQCGYCHSLSKQANSFGPSLAKVIGRRVGSDAGFAYSPALKGSDLIWDYQLFLSFVTNPGKAFPGTRMPKTGVTEDETGKIYEFLRSLEEKQ